ncbi:MAG: undecaprenyldiphospho-muramoylpentapeptide beta-N-acetylglucosaminyltransferase [Balneolaceae bacterium]
MTAAVKNISSTDTPTAALNAPRVLIAAGGTGGHVYPGIAIADALKELNPDMHLLFAGTRNRMEWTAVPKAGYDIKRVWISGFHRRLTPKNLLFPVKLVTSLLQSFWIIKRFRPDLVISCGGFAAGPIGWAAAKMNIPLILQEQNSFPGVTSRLLAGHADFIYTAFESAADHLPPEKIQLTGNPVRSELENTDREQALAHFGFSDSQPVLLVLGGSGGAKGINDAVVEHLDHLHNELGLQIIWQCGKRYISGLSGRIDSGRLPRLRLVEFIDNMPAAYAAADLVVSRAGALSCSELMLTGKPSVLVPSSNVAGDHQTKNAASMVRGGAAILLPDNQARKQLGPVVSSTIFDGKKLSDMSRAAAALARPDAARVIAKEIVTLISRNHE